MFYFQFFINFNTLIMRKTIIALLVSFSMPACKQPATNGESSFNTLPTFRDPMKVISPTERYGALFDSVQMSEIFPDSKTFIDCIPSVAPDSILAIYEVARKKPDFNLQNFVSQYFTPAKKTLIDYTSDRSQTLEAHIDGLFSALTHSPDTMDHSSLLPLPKPYITKNGAATDVNYWDSYFIMLGLKAAGRIDLVENMVDNFAYLIHTEGYVPSANRSYYLSRSQPPFFACMVQLLAETKGQEVYKKYLPQLEKEYQFWMDGKTTEQGPTLKRRTATVDGNTLNRYYDDKDSPRPEWFKEDKALTQKNSRDIKHFYRQLRAGSESGWEYSSRWLGDTKDLSNIYITDIVPVDLNALLYNLELVIMKGKILEKKMDEAANYEKLASKRRDALMRYCWDNEKQMFFDFDFQKYRKKDVPSLAAVFPLCFRMVTKREADKVAEAIKTKFLKPGGVVTTLNNTGQNWDAPYGYAPLQWMTIRGLRNYGYHELANDIKKRWIDMNTQVFQSTGKILDKYNVEDISINSSANNYPTQDGFGWSNGVLMTLLKEK